MFHKNLRAGWEYDWISCTTVKRPLTIPAMGWYDEVFSRVEVSPWISPISAIVNDSLMRLDRIKMSLKTFGLDVVLDIGRLLAAIGYANIIRVVTMYMHDFTLPISVRAERDTDFIHQLESIASPSRHLKLHSMRSYRATVFLLDLLISIDNSWIKIIIILTRSYLVTARGLIRFLFEIQLIYGFEYL